MVLDIKKIVAGRKAVEEYREAHTKLYEKKADRYEHAPLAAQLVAKLADLGFQGIDGFFEANEQANIEALSEAVIKTKYCDGCPGKRKKACVAGCYNKAMEERKGPAGVLERARARRLMNAKNYAPAHWAKHLPLKVGDEFSMYPDCNIMLKVVKEPEIDWQWR